MVDARWLREVREKLKERGLAARIARDLKVSPSSVTRLKKGEAGSLGLVLAVSSHLEIAPPLGLASDVDERGQRLMELYRRIQRAGATDAQLEELLATVEALAIDLEAAHQQQEEAAAKTKAAWSRIRRDLPS